MTGLIGSAILLLSSWFVDDICVYKCLLARSLLDIHQNVPSGSFSSFPFFILRLHNYTNEQGLQCIYKL